MMKQIYLIDYDGKIPNLALMRLSTYWKNKGAHVQLFKGHRIPEMFDNPDKVYISCLFRWNHSNALECTYQWNGKAIIGGTGVDEKIQLPKEMQQCSPDLSLYPSTQAIGFISRGCNRKCLWCIVPTKEGKLHRVSTAKEIVRRFKEVKFLDNNFLALSDCQKDLQWLSRQNIKIDFNQGLDARLVTLELAELLSACQWISGPRFSCDSEYQLQSIEKTIKLFDKIGYNIKKITIFVLIGFHSFQSDIQRLWQIHELGVRPFPMGFRDLKTGKEIRNGWNKELYQKYKRLICRIPFAKSVWSDFQNELL